MKKDVRSVIPADIASVKKMKIYTKKGDKGESYTLLGEKLPKDDVLFEALGQIDELNSLIGLFLARFKNSKEKDILLLVQRSLYKIMAQLSGYKQPIVQVNTLVKKIEQKIDSILSRQDNKNRFVLFNNTEEAAFLNWLRTVARRVERRVVSLKKARKVDERIVVFFNRLSDLFFALSREAEDKEVFLEI